MDPEVQKTLIIATAIVIVVVVALILGRRLSLSFKGGSLKADEKRPSMDMSATKGGSIEKASMVTEGKPEADMKMTARDGTLKDVEQRAGGQSDKQS